jgi:hypothetical protein
MFIFPLDRMGIVRCPNAIGCFFVPNGPRIRRRRVTRRAHQTETQFTAKTGNNKTLDQAAGRMCWLGAVCHF